MSRFPYRSSAGPRRVGAVPIMGLVMVVFLLAGCAVNGPGAAGGPRRGSTPPPPSPGPESLPADLPVHVHPERTVVDPSIRLDGRSHSWAGYVDTFSNASSLPLAQQFPFQSVTAYFSVPVLDKKTCQQPESNGIGGPYSQVGLWAGFDGGSSGLLGVNGSTGSVEQTGILASCSVTYTTGPHQGALSGKGGPEYLPFYELIPKPPVLDVPSGFSVQGGDVVKAEVVEDTATGTYAFTLRDYRWGYFKRRWQWNETDLLPGVSPQACGAPSGCPRSTAEVVVEDPHTAGSGVVPYAPYGLASLWGAWVTNTGGQSGGLDAGYWNSTEFVTIKDAQPAILQPMTAQPSSLSPDSGSEQGEQFWVYQQGVAPSPSPSPSTSPGPKGTATPTPTLTTKPSPAASTPPPATSTTAYVTDGNDNQVTPVSLSTRTAEAPIPLPGDPEGIAITPDGKTAYVTAPQSDTVTPINLANDTLGTPITVNDLGIGIAITPDGRTAYVTHALGGSITPINLATGALGPAIPLSGGVGGVAITPDGRTAYVTDIGGTVTPVDLTTGTPGGPITVPGGPAAIAITPDGTTAYAADSIGNTVIPINLATNQAGHPISVPEGVEGGIAISPDAKTAWLTTGAATISPLDLATGTLGSAIAVPIGDGAGLAITP
jgi:DNA-binding beta-propeller fold protein YncE